MSRIDIEHLRTWIGRTHVNEDVIAPRHARLMAATIDLPDPARIADGAPLPPLWHWLYFLEGLPPGELGRDGHPARGGFLPPVPLPNRMWAGGRVAFLAPVPIGARVKKVSSILKVDHKVGRSGDLVFVTVLHEIRSLAGEPLIREEHDIVYKSAGRPPAAADAQPAAAAPFTKTFTPTSTTLFRYSALTFNGHRIHYDLDYCRHVEGYADLVIHGPLNATLLAGFAEDASGRRVREFNYRGLAPALLGETITLGATIDGDRVALAATLGSGVRSMEAEARLVP
ncbi:acyl-CoA dehydrogenase [Propionivibrio sp.]|uniref:acyl-CoA dehydrogenase n=1 Tax=Propionivibrio sp. TaxID=2212460 RepID=UPI0039E553A1